MESVADEWTANGENEIWGIQKTSENDRGHAICQICFEDGVRRRQRRMNKLQVRLQQAVTIATILYCHTLNTI